MLRCREISKLVSESMERDLSLGTRMQLRMHLMMCRMCSGFSKQVRMLSRAIREDPDRLAAEEEDPEAMLSDQARTDQGDVARRELLRNMCPTCFTKLLIHENSRRLLEIERAFSKLRSPGS